MNVLIVEDNPISAKVLEHTLDKYGYETLTAHDGDQALEFLESHPEIELLITDIMMPKTNGVELVRKIKERHEWSELPILVCTSLKPTSINNAIPMQGWKYLFKPIKADSLIRMVKEAISQQRAVLQSPDQTMAEIGMDSQAFLEILDEFLKVVKDKIALLEDRIKQPSDAPLDLQHLMESAKLVRADRMIDVIERLNRVADGTKRKSIRSMYPLLLRELKSMQYYLTLYSSYQSNNNSRRRELQLWADKMSMNIVSMLESITSINGSNCRRCGAVFDAQKNQTESAGKSAIGG